MKIGKKYIIHAYKHNGDIYKSWSEAIFLDETPEYYVFANKNVVVTEKYGKKWKTREPAVLFYFKNDWFNVIAQMKKNGIYFYCNIATPLSIEKNVIKFIDYDLDLRIFPDRTYKILDRSEYNLHKDIMNYPKELDKIVNYELKKLIKKYRNGYEIFNKRLISYYNNQYFKIKNRQK